MILCSLLLAWSLTGLRSLPRVLGSHLELERILSSRSDIAQQRQFASDLIYSCPSGGRVWYTLLPVKPGPYGGRVWYTLLPVKPGSRHTVP